MTQREKIFWLVLGAVYVVGLIALIPVHGEICKEGAKAGEEACTSYNLLPFLLIKIGQALDALGVAITALATIAIAWFTWSLRRSTDKLWDAGERQLKLLADTSAAQARDMQDSILVAKDAATAAKDQVELSRRALINVQRAMIVATKTHAMVGIKGSTGEVIDWTFYVVWENAGNTPTKHSFMHTSWRFFEAEESPENFDFADAGFGPVKRVPFIIGPKASTWSAECEIPIDKILAVRENKGRLLIWAWVEYDDVFDGTSRHRTEHCFEIKVPGVPTVHTNNGEPLIPFRYQGYEKYNGMDEECMRPLQTGSPKNPLPVNPT